MKTSRQHAYDRIRAAIMSGKFPPGFQVKEEEMAELCGVSRTPARQAMTMLADEGLLEIRENRRSYVANVTRAHADEVFRVMSFLEGFSAALAAERVTAEDLAEIKALQRRIKEVETLSPGDDRPYLELNSEFHKVIHRAARNSTIYDLIQRIVDFPQSIYLKLGRVTESQWAIDQHERIIEALEKHNPQAAQMHMQYHVECVCQQYRDLWDEVHDKREAQRGRDKTRKPAKKAK